MNRTLVIPAAVPVTTSTSAAVPAAKGVQQRVPAAQHRFVARVEAQVGLSGKTRMVRATEEARDLTSDASAVLSAAAADRLSSNVASGAPGAAASGAGEPAEIAACENCSANPPEQAFRRAL